MLGFDNFKTVHLFIVIGREGVYLTAEICKLHGRVGVHALFRIKKRGSLLPLVGLLVHGPALARGGGGGEIDGALGVCYLAVLIAGVVHILVIFHVV